MKKFITPVNIIYSVLLTLLVNCYVLVRAVPYLLILLVPLFLYVNLVAGTVSSRTKSFRIRLCSHGGVLLGAFALSIIPSLVYHTVLAILVITRDPWQFIWSLIVCVAASACVFWNGIVCVYCTSSRMGIRWRVVGALCGMIPIVNIVALDRIISTVMDEVSYEIEKEEILSSGNGEYCKTKYPILFVHGVFFRDSKNFNYWGRIPRSLKARGATVYYGEHESALPVAESGKELASRIRYIIDRYGCEKVNIIAHSKGGIDCRWALAYHDVGKYVASLTTINTPHRGCLFADRLLDVIPKRIQRAAALAYNTTLRELGDENPDFIAAVTDLTAEKCIPRDSEMKLPDGIYSQSVGSVLNRARGGKFPLNLSYLYVKKYDGRNDGLVGEGSFEWGSKYTLLTTEHKRGISHADVIDLMRDDRRDFDVRAFYTELVHDLKERGL